VTKPKMLFFLLIRYCEIPSLAHDTIDAGAFISKMDALIGVNVALNKEQAIVDEMIVDTSFALAPETMSLSIVAGAGAVYLHHVDESWVEKHADKVADKAIDTVAIAGHKVTTSFFSFLVKNLYKMYRCLSSTTSPLTSG